MYLRDWEDFKNDVSWFVKEGDIVEVGETKLAKDGVYKPSKAYKNTFLLFDELIYNARITDINFNGKKYYLYGWTDKKEKSFGWLCKLPSKKVDNKLGEDHKLLLSCFGGIVETWNEIDGSWLCNLNSALTEEESNIGFGDWESFIHEICFEEGVEEYIDPEDYISFAFEANGNLTMYNRLSGDVIMLAPDHCFDYITPLDGYPEYTLYRINNCKDFICWVEKVAKIELSRFN